MDPGPGLQHAVLLSAAAFAVVWIQLAASIGLRGGMEPVSFRDFGSLWASGDAANRGLNPYAPREQAFRVTSPAGEWIAVNLNPPFSVLLFQAIARLDPRLGFRLVQVASAVGFVAILLALVRSAYTTDAPLRVLLLLLWHPFWSTLDLGQVYVALLGLVVVALLAQERRPWLAACCIGALVALKPPFVLWPVFLFAAGQRALAIRAMLVAGALSAIPLLMGHVEWYGQWVEASLTAAVLRLAVDNLSGIAVLVRWGVPWPLAGMLVAASVLGLLAFVRRRRSRFGDATGVGLVAALWASPVTWVGYSVLLAPVFLTRRYWPEPMLIAALLFAIPGPLIWWTEPAAAMVYLVAGGLCLLGILMDRS